MSAITPAYYSVDNYPKIFIYCGVKGTSRSLGNSVENYPKCEACEEKPDIQRRKRKTVVQTDLGNKKKK